MTGSTYGMVVVEKVVIIRTLGSGNEFDGD